MLEWYVRLYVDHTTSNLFLFHYAMPYLSFADLLNSVDSGVDCTPAVRPHGEVATARLPYAAGVSSSHGLSFVRPHGMSLTSNQSHIHSKPLLNSTGTSTTTYSHFVPSSTSPVSTPVPPPSGPITTPPLLLPVTQYNVCLNRKTTLATLYHHPPNTCLEYPETAESGAIGHLFAMDPNQWINPTAAFAYSLGAPSGRTKTGVHVTCPLLVCQDDPSVLVPCTERHSTCM